MKILALEASGGTAGCALAEDGKVLGELEMNIGKTHSQTLVPMLDELRRMTELDLHTVDAIALTAGPGSFTGLRIGAATAKGIALALEKPVIGVSTLESLAFNILPVLQLPPNASKETGALVCPIMDARRQQVYAAIYEGTMTIWTGSSAVKAKEIRPAMDDEHKKALQAGAGTQDGTAPHSAGIIPCLRRPCAVSAEELMEDLNACGREVIFLGDGVPVYRSLMDERLTVPHSCAPGHLALQRAASTAVLAGMMYEACGETVLTGADDFRPVYLRKTQAEQQQETAAETGRMAALAAGRLLKEMRAEAPS